MPSVLACPSVWKALDSGVTTDSQVRHRDRAVCPPEGLTEEQIPVVSMFEVVQKIVPEVQITVGGKDIY